MHGISIKREVVSVSVKIEVVSISVKRKVLDRVLFNMSKCELRMKTSHTMGIKGPAANSNSSVVQLN